MVNAKATDAAIVAGKLLGDTHTTLETQNPTKSCSPITTVKTRTHAHCTHQTLLTSLHGDNLFHTYCSNATRPVYLLSSLAGTTLVLTSPPPPPPSSFHIPRLPTIQIGQLSSTLSESLITPHLSMHLITTTYSLTASFLV